MRIKKILLILTVFVFMFAICINSKTIAAKSDSELCTIEVPVKYGQTDARNMLNLINDFRTGDDAWIINQDNTTKTTYSNLGNLKYDYKLEEFAMQRAAEIALSFSHTRTDGTICYTVINDRSGYPGENILAGKKSPNEVFKYWQEENEDYDNQGHRRNMLSPDFTAIGIGHVTYQGCDFWVQEFSTISKEEQETEANNNNENATVNIKKSLVNKIEVSTPTQITVDYGKTSDLPAISSMNILLQNSFLKKCNVIIPISWKIKDENYAKIKDNKIEGIKIGKTELEAEIMWEDRTIPLTVRCSHMKMEKIDGIAPTCYKEGNNTYYKCDDCKKFFKDEKGTQETTVEAEKLGKLNHDYEATTKPATCAEEGYTTYTCKNCEDSYVGNIIPKLSHELTHVEAVESTCSKEGNNEYYWCPICNLVYKDKDRKNETKIEWEKIPRNENHHTPGKIVKENEISATCIKEGSYDEVVYCDGCGKELSREHKIIEKLSTHSPALAVKENVVAATCTKEGSYDEVVYCDMCNEELSREHKTVSKVAHTWDSGKVTKVATCIETGIKTYTCTCCEETKTEIIAKTAHTYKTTTTKATLSKNGSIVTKCSVCGYVKSNATIAYPKTISLSKTTFTFNNKAQTPTVTVKGNDGKVIPASNYTVTYSNKNSKNVGEYSITITFKGNYEGTKKITYKINPKGTSLKKLTTGKKQFKATWNKQATQTTGYQIQYSTNSKFKSGNKTVKVNKNKTTSSIVKKLKAKKKYYVRIRTYKTVKVNGKNVTLYSGWSKAKNVKTK